jgi:hypothetical protein
MCSPASWVLRRSAHRYGNRRSVEMDDWRLRGEEKSKHALPRPVALAKSRLERSSKMMQKRVACGERQSCAHVPGAAEGSRCAPGWSGS